VGLLPQRRTRLGGRGLARVACGWTAVKSGASISFPEAGAVI
jgi:hypothetical protein